MIKGFKTVGFNALMLAGTITGAQLDPELMRDWIEALATAWTGGNLIIRTFTDSPIFKRW